MIIDKPKIGEPCNGCGLCCESRVCRSGSSVLKLVSELGKAAPGPCPAIVRLPDGSIRCGIILNPNKYIKNSKYPAKVLRKYFVHLVGADTGCDELYENDTLEEKTKLQQALGAIKNNSEYAEKTRKAVRIIYNV